MRFEKKQMKNSKSRGKLNSSSTFCITAVLNAVE